VPEVAAAAMPATAAPATPPSTIATTTIPPAPAPATTTTTRGRVQAGTAALSAPAPAPAPSPHVSSSGGMEPCGWTWDAIRIDDGSSNEVTLSLGAARRPDETVTIFADFAGPDSPTAARTVRTDQAGQASATFPVSEDKRDWTITISASFASGGACPAETITLDY
jgi:hypothetical protein